MTMIRRSSGRRWRCRPGDGDTTRLIDHVTGVEQQLIELTVQRGLSGAASCTAAFDALVDDLARTAELIALLDVGGADADGAGTGGAPRPAAVG